MRQQSVWLDGQWYTLWLEWRCLKHQGEVDNDTMLHEGNFDPTAVCIQSLMVALQMEENFGYTVLHLTQFCYHWRLAHYVTKGLILYYCTSYILFFLISVRSLNTKKKKVTEFKTTYLITLASSMNSSSLIVPSFIILTATCNAPSFPCRTTPNWPEPNSSIRFNWLGSTSHLSGRKRRWDSGK